MIRTTRTTAAVTMCAGLLAGGAAAAVAQDSSPATPAAQELKLTIPAKSFHYKTFDAKPKGDSTGDSDVNYASVSGSGRKGHIVQNCVLAKAGRTNLFTCNGVLELGSGTIYFATGGVDKEGPTQIAITGGTGDFAAANGTIVIDQAGKDFSVDVHLQ